MLQYFETILPLVESLWSSQQDEVHLMGGWRCWRPVILADILDFTKKKISHSYKVCESFFIIICKTVSTHSVIYAPSLSRLWLNFRIPAHLFASCWNKKKHIVFIPCLLKHWLAKWLSEVAPKQIPPPRPPSLLKKPAILILSVEGWGEKSKGAYG